MKLLCPRCGEADEFDGEFWTEVRVSIADCCAAGATFPNVATAGGVCESCAPALFRKLLERLEELVQPGTVELLVQPGTVELAPVDADEVET